MANGTAANWIYINERASVAPLLGRYALIKPWGPFTAHVTLTAENEATVRQIEAVGDRIVCFGLDQKFKLASDTVTGAGFGVARGLGQGPYVWSRTIVFSSRRKQAISELAESLLDIFASNVHSSSA